MNLPKALKSLFVPAPRVDPRDASARVRAREALVIDVREPAEWRSGVVEGATLLPMSDLSAKRVRWKAFLASAGQKELLLYCASGMRSALAAKTLAAEGYRAANTGGVGDWAAAGWSIVRPKE